MITPRLLIIPKEHIMETLLIAGGFVAVYLLLQIVILPKLGIST